MVIQVEIVDPCRVYTFDDGKHPVSVFATSEKQARQIREELLNDKGRSRIG